MNKFMENVSNCSRVGYTVAKLLLHQRKNRIDFVFFLPAEKTPVYMFSCLSFLVREIYIATAAVNCTQSFLQKKITHSVFASCSCLLDPQSDMEHGSVLKFILLESTSC